jgi:hypothetical protein
MIKNSAEVTSIISLLHDAKKHIEEYPSTAVDAGTAGRTTIHLLTRMLNKLSSACEYSGNQCVSHLLGLPAEYYMHNLKRTYLFASDAILYVTKCMAAPRSEQAPLSAVDSDSSFGSSWIYSSDSEQCASSGYSVSEEMAEGGVSDSARSQPAAPVAATVPEADLPMSLEVQLEEFGIVELPGLAAVGWRRTCPGDASGH